jgi:homocysteine S-methyltransferase
VRNGDVLLIDGGLGTELESRGYDLQDPLWSARLLMDAPDAIRDVHRAYRAAGADVLVSASFQATIAGFVARGAPPEQARELLRLSVRLAREAGPGRVAASVGPYGAARADGSEFTGLYDLDEAELAAWHEERFRVLAAARADLLACETIPSFSECRALLRLLQRTPGATAWFSFACRDGEHIADGTPILDCARLLEPEGRVVAIGVNCTAPRHLPSLLETLRAASVKPIVAYPNSGERWDAAGRRWLGARDPGDFATAARTWRAAGATWIGGCCRTGPAHIAALRAAF